MDVALWIVAGVLAAGFLAAGIMKLVQPREKLAASGLTWVEDYSANGVRAIGALEVLAAIGLVLPALLDIVPVLVPVTAVAVALLMAGAAWTHYRRREMASIAVPVVLLLLAAFVAWGRFGPEPF
jgi:uncharacterized membrane protein YphA (DoxX/SURF4 family)